MYRKAGGPPLTQGDCAGYDSGAPPATCATYRPKPFTVEALRNRSSQAFHNHMQPRAIGRIGLTEVEQYIHRAPKV